MARPPVEIDLPKLKALMRLKPTLEDTAAFFECSIRTIERYIREQFDLSFVAFREQNMVHTRLNLVRKAIEKAERGDNTMLIFCLKNVCGWRDKQPEEVTQIVNNNVTEEKLSDEQMAKLLKVARGNG